MRDTLIEKLVIGKQVGSKYVKGNLEKKKNLDESVVSIRLCHKLIYQNILSSCIVNKIPKSNIGA